MGKERREWIGKRCLCKAKNRWTPGWAPRGRITKVGRAFKNSNSEHIVDVELTLFFLWGVDQNLA